MELNTWPQPFDGIPLASVALVYAIYFFGFFIRGSFGFGSNLPVVVVSAWVLSPHHTVLLASMVASIMQIQLLPQGIRGPDWSRVIPVVGAMVIGNAIGVWLLTLLEADWLLIVLGLIVAVLVLIDVLKLLARIGNTVNLRSPRTAAAIATVSSTVGTVSGGGALYLLMPFLKLVALTPLQFRCTNIMIAGLSSMVRILMLSAAGLITLELIVDAVALLPAVVAGTLAGTRYFRMAAPAQFFRTLQFVMLFAAVLLTAKGVAASF